jgi:hypothetical protein
MNERIAELWNKAAKSTKDDSWSSQVTFVEKFAELIVKECMEVAGASYTSTPEDCVYYVDLAVNRIAEHFGVEE